MDDHDKLWILLGIGVLAVTQLIHSRMIAKLQDDVRFGLIVARPTTTAAEAHDE